MNTVAIFAVISVLAPSFNRRTTFTSVAIVVPFPISTTTTRSSPSLTALLAQRRSQR